MSWWVVTIITIALILASAFFVIVEFALLAARRHRLEEEADRSASARAALRGVNELTVNGKRQTSASYYDIPLKQAKMAP